MESNNPETESSLSKFKATKIIINLYAYQVDIYYSPGMYQSKVRRQSNDLKSYQHSKLAW
jgi:hypothetical protein